MNAEDQGGLPEAICEMARALIRERGFSRQHAIAAAVNRAKRLIADPDSKPDTRAKYAKAIAEWESKKAKTHAKNAVKASVSNETISDEDMAKEIADTYCSCFDSSLSKFEDNVSLSCMLEI